MRNWGIVVTGFYMIVVAALSPLSLLLTMDRKDSSTGEFLSKLVEFHMSWGGIIWVAVLVAAPLVLLVTRVDLTRKNLMPQRQKRVAVAAIAFAVALLSAAALASLTAAALGDDIVDFVLYPLPVFWLAWGVVFNRHADFIFDRERWLYKGLIGGSVLELLIAVPSNVIAQNRDQCSAPAVTAYGVSTGIALLFMAFGPAILLLYRKRMTLSRPARDAPEGEE